MSDESVEELKKLRDRFVALGVPKNSRESELFRILTEFLQLTNDAQLRSLKKIEKLQQELFMIKRSIYNPGRN